jgi:hypothetical protein
MGEWGYGGNDRFEGEIQGEEQDSKRAHAGARAWAGSRRQDGKRALAGTQEAVAGEGSEQQMTAEKRRRKGNVVRGLGGETLGVWAGGRLRATGQGWDGGDG